MKDNSNGTFFYESSVSEGNEINFKRLLHS